MNLPKLLGIDYYNKKLPVTEPGAKKNKIRSKLLLLVLVLYHYFIFIPIKEPPKYGKETLQYIEKISIRRINLFYHIHIMRQNKKPS